MFNERDSYAAAPSKPPMEMLPRGRFVAYARVPTDPDAGALAAVRATERTDLESRV
jgi:hypothetical protein